MTEAMDVSPGMQAAWLFLLALPIACIAWTVTHEDLFREVRDYCVRRSEEDRRWYVRKFFYVFTCEYCFSHYVALGFLAMTSERVDIKLKEGELQKEGEPREP